MKFKAAVLRQSVLPRPYASSRPLAIESVEVPPPAAGEVLVSIKAASLCHSDLSVINGDRAWPLPIVPGHEAAGRVEETGPGVESVKPGDHVALIFLTQCGECEHCIEGRPFLCARGTQANREGRLLGGGPRLRLGDEPVHHHMGLSAFAEYALVSEKSLVKIPPDLPFVQASLFGCAVMCGAGTALYTAGIRPGQSVAVFGLGGVGLAAVLGAVTAGATRIIAVDPDERKRVLARDLGATECVASDGMAGSETVRELSQGGVDHAIDASSSLDGFRAAFEATRRGGSTVTTSLVHPSQTFSFPLARLVAEARTIRGSYIGSCVPGRDIPAFIGLFRQGRMPVDKLVTRTLPLERINEAFDALADASEVRQVITF
ncbi:MAG TPA: zinc-dependent alcohol dehydrogenase family protein [Candidatus Desulfobacillus sp.]|nr:zinc-dependent alcohol dehydrogenase family protein [Candidatus Desulfobacillus sp.]